MSYTQNKGKFFEGTQETYNQMCDLESSWEEGRMKVFRMVRRLLTTIVWGLTIKKAKWLNPVVFFYVAASI